MAINITLRNVKASDQASLLNNAHIKSSDVSIGVEDLVLKGEANVLSHLKIEDTLQELDQVFKSLDVHHPEYYSIRDILSTSRKDKRLLAAKFVKHVGNFAQGVLASVLANHIS